MSRGNTKGDAMFDPELSTMSNDHGTFVIRKYRGSSIGGFYVQTTSLSTDRGRGDLIGREGGSIDNITQYKQDKSMDQQ